MKMLKQAVFIISIFAITILLLPSLSFAGIPKTINYQGKLTGPSGSPVSDGTYSVTFRIYDQGAGGSPLWYETQYITTQKGIFSTQIGATKDLDLAFDKPYYLGIQVSADSEMTPRQSLSSSAYAFEAAHAAVATTLTDETQLIPSGVILMWSGSISTIPDGWVLCNGINGTPDLSDRFILGVTFKSVARIGNHGPDGSSSGIDFTIRGSGNDIYTRTDTRVVSSIAREGGNLAMNSHNHNYFPPYYALCYIMKE